MGIKLASWQLWVFDDDLPSACRYTHDLDRSGSIATGTPYQYSVRWSRTQPALSPLEHWWSYHRKMYHKTCPADHLCHSRIPRGNHCYRRLHTLWRSLLASAGRSEIGNKYNDEALIVGRSRMGAELSNHPFDVESANDKWLHWD